MQEQFFEAVDLLDKLTNLDALINTLVAKPKMPTPQQTKSAIRTIISLQHVLGLASRLCTCVGVFRNSRAWSAGCWSEWWLCWQVWWSVGVWM